MLEKNGETDRGEIERKASERCLGYGNRAMLLASPFNVPTQTLTVFWAAGNVRGVQWDPLMARRKKV
jgi:deoxynucleoside triphosphate triphosphohydrolase SAMHD1